MNSLVYIFVYTTHHTFIQRHPFTETQPYQVKQVPREFDTRYSLTVLYYLHDPVHLPTVEQVYGAIAEELLSIWKSLVSFKCLFVVLLLREYFFIFWG